jgi:ATP-dependent helicase/nuclease subunit B
MTPFLKQVAQYIFDEHKTDMSQLCIVLPSKRGAIFLKKYLHEVFKKTIWLPKILSIDEFISELSQTNILDNLNCLIEMHPFFQKHIDEAILNSPLLADVNRDENTTSFEQYLRKGITMLQDFNEIDRHLVETTAIFSNLKDIKYIENWSLNNETLSTFQKNYIALFEAIGKIYDDFRVYLTSKNIAYQGLAYRIAVNNFKFDKWQPLDKHFLFCGFNAFNKAEDFIISGLCKQKKATVLWDGDEYFLNDEIQEAGFFLREAKQNKQFGSSFNFINNYLHTDEKKIAIIGAPNNIAQTQVVQSQLNEWFKINLEINKTAVVMADEALLMPVLYAIPEEIDKLNVTLGYELRHSIFYDLIIKWINMQEYAYNNQQKLYYKDINKILSHVTIEKYFESNTQKKYLKKLQNNLIKYNIIFTSHDRLKSFINEDIQFINYFFTPIDTIHTFLNKCLEVIDLFKEKLLQVQSSQRISVIEEQVLFELSKIFNQLITLNIKINQKLSIKDLKSIFQQIVSTTSVDFKGEPLNGLQIMGVLETRTLDFENIIITSVNEGILPTGKGGSSFIPYDLKLHFGLPVHHNKDAIYAYHFWHIIQRAKNICIVYNTEGDDLQKGEKSRFVTQLESELVHNNKNIHITHKIHSSLNQNNQAGLDLKVVSNDTIQAALIERFKIQTDKENQLGLSPSSINTYLNCSLKFYYQYVLRLKETEEQEEVIQADTFGNIIHKALEILYEPYVGKVLTIEFLNAISDKIDNTAKNAFNEILKIENDTTYNNKGKNFLALVSIKKYLQQLVDFDIERVKLLATQNQLITLIGLELSFNKTMVVNVNQANEMILFSGKIDRIEQVGNELSIIDFKSNLGEKSQLQLKHIDDIFYPKKTKKDKALQLLFYQWILAESPIAKNKVIKPNILSIRAVKQGFQGLELKMEDTLQIDLIDDFSHHLKNLVEKMIAKNNVFEATNDQKICEWCSFKKICYRD